MPFSYVQHNSPFLRQGEIIANLLEPRLRIVELTAIDANQPAKVDPIHHPYLIIVSQDCDLEWDYKARKGKAPNHKLLTHILFCALLTRDEIIDQRDLKQREYDRMSKNQDERYHHFDTGRIDGTTDSLPEVVADFKATFSLPLELVYWLIDIGQASRHGALFSPYLEQFMHRLYSFLGRVATP